MNSFVLIYFKTTEGIQYNTSALLAKLVSEPLIKSTITRYLFNHLNRVAFHRKDLPAVLLQKNKSKEGKKKRLMFSFIYLGLFLNLKIQFV